MDATITDLMRTWPTGLEAMLEARSDSRATRDPETGLSRYGCAPRPRPGVLALGSCTASSLSPIALPGLLRRWHAHEAAAASGQALAFVAHAYAEIRAELVRCLAPAAPAGLEVVLTPSGTDAELLATWLAMPDAPGRLRNLVVGPDEVGSGTVLAAGGRAFDPCSPLGGDGRRGEPLAGFDAERVEVSGIAIRHADGRALDALEVEARLDAAIADAIAAGDRVLLHVLVHSKTGLHHPRREAVVAWRRRFGPGLRVLVDAAQARLPRRELQAWLEAGAAVMVTGSKFYGGPPFSGALLIPPAAELSPRTPVPAGLAAFVTRWDMPAAWAPHLAALSPGGNASLAWRWLAALETMRAYQAIPSPRRAAIRLGFAEAVRATVGASRHVAWLNDAVPHPGDRTVFSFTLMGPDGPLGMARLREVHAALAADADGFHLGQPVRLGAEGGREVAVLRIALGAALAGELAEGRLEDGLDRLAGRLSTLRHRLEALAGAGALRP